MQEHRSPTHNLHDKYVEFSGIQIVFKRGNDSSFSSNTSSILGLEVVIGDCICLNGASADNSSPSISSFNSSEDRG